MPHPLFTTYNLKASTFQAIKNRIYIVGKFNGTPANPADPRDNVYHFSKSGKAKTDPHYLPENCHSLTYKAFNNALKPSLVEIRRRHQVTGIDTYELRVKSKGDNNDVTTETDIRIDENNYFFLRASSNSDHPIFKAQTPNLPDIITTVVGQADAKDRYDKVGEHIFMQVKSGLKDFADFQTRNTELLDTFSHLLAANKNKAGIPAYAHGNLFPENFSSAFIDYLYSSDSDSTFDLASLGFKSIAFWADSVWNNSTGSLKPNFEASFKELVTKYKEMIADSEFPNLIDSNLSPNELNYEILKTKITKDLRSGFSKAKNSFNLLNQITGSKVLLSMILRWAVNRFERQSGLPDLDTDKDKAISDAIFKGVTGKIAPPDKTFADGYNQKAAKNQFNGYYGTVIDYVCYAEYLRAPQHHDSIPESIRTRIMTNLLTDFAAMPEFLQSKATALEEDSKVKDDLRKIRIQELIAGKPIIGSVANVITDDLYASVFKEPGLGEQELIEKVQSLYNDLFLTSATLKVTQDPKNRKQLKEIIEKGLRDTGKRGGGTGAAVGGSQAQAIAQIQEDNKNIVMSNSVDAMIVILLDDEVSANREGIMTAMENRETLQELGISGSSKGVSNFVPQLAVDHEDNGFSKKIATILIQQIVNKIKASDHNRMKEKLGKIISRKKAHYAKINEDIQNPVPFSESEFEKLLSEYLTDSNKENEAKLKTQIERDTVYYNQNLAHLYETYKKGNNLDDFRNKVDTATLSKLLLLEKEARGLEGGDNLGTNLLDLVLDLVENLDRDKPDLEDFFSKTSLTKYIKKEVFDTEDGSGYTALKTLLDQQASKSFENIVQYVSELKGIWYLFQKLQDSGKDVEVIVLNFTADEFVKWLQAQLTLPQGYHKAFNPVYLFQNENQNIHDQFASCILMSDLAFEDSDGMSKNGFLSALKAPALLTNGNNVQIIPPVIIASGPDSKWKDELLQNVLAPVLTIGPSLPLNRITDQNFRTTLSTGYLFGLQILISQYQAGLVSPIDISIPEGKRSRIVGKGSQTIAESLTLIISPKNCNGEDSYAFDADYFLYMITLLRTAMKNNGKYPGLANNPPADQVYVEFMKYFIYDQFNNHYNAYIGQIENLLIDSKMSDWTLNASQFQQLGVLKGVSLYKDVTSKEDANGRNKIFKQAAWFNLQSEALGFPSGTDPVAAPK